MFGLNVLKYVPGSSFSQLHVQGIESACNAGDAGDVDSISGLRRSPGGGRGNLFQYSCLKNPMDRGAWQAAAHGVTRVGHD